MSNNQETTILQEQEQSVNVFEAAIRKYISKLNSQIDTMPLVLRVLSTNAIMKTEKLKDFFDEYGISNLEVNEPVKIPIQQYGRLRHLSSQVDTAMEATMLYPCNMVVSLVSMYDAFVGDIIKAIYATCPKKLNESKKSIVITDILKFESIEDAKDYVIEKEAEDVLRENHKKQLDWFQNKLGHPFDKFESFSKFIEITERRNLFVHTNGIVSRQYIDVCKEYKVKDVSEVKIGEKLIATPKYVYECYSVLYEVGVKLGFVVWRLLEKDTEEADYNLNSICYDLLKQGKNHLAKTMLHFATDVIKKPANEEIRRLFIINKALAYYLLGDKKTCNEIIDKEDWSATAVKFQLATAVLREDYESAAKKMEAAKSDINNIDYCEWPLFKDFRNSKEFKSQYSELFGQDFEYTEPEQENYKNVLQYALELQDKVKHLIKTKAEADADGGDCEISEEMFES